MRLWSLHPSILDSKGLVACWRESLLAKAVLENKTNGYKNHPQLQRFRATKDPVKAINVYLYLLWQESFLRGYKFDKSKIEINLIESWEIIEVTTGQVEFELQHLRKKCEIRDKEWYNLMPIDNIPVCGMFKIIQGPIESWEVL